VRRLGRKLAHKLGLGRLRRLRRGGPRPRPTG
jgi:hypothetical protein